LDFWISLEVWYEQAVGTNCSTMENKDDIVEVGRVIKLPALTRLDSQTMVSLWSDFQTLESVPSEYRKAIEMCCVKPEFMRVSKIDHVIQYLDGILEAEPDLKAKVNPKTPGQYRETIVGLQPDFESVLKKCICKAYFLESEDEAPRQYCLIWNQYIFKKVRFVV
jgi:hypothetical protein